MTELETKNKVEGKLEEATKADTASNDSKQKTSIKEKIMSLNGDEEFDKLEYTNIVLDDLNLHQITDEDREYLEGFTECQYLSLNSTQLKSLVNLPKLPKLIRLDIMDNMIETGLEIIADRYNND